MLEESSENEGLKLIARERHDYESTSVPQPVKQPTDIANKIEATVRLPIPSGQVLTHVDLNAAILVSAQWVLFRWILIPRARLRWR